MAADSAVTTTYRTGLRSVNPTGARKLHSVPALTAGVSCWGIGTIEDQPTDLWLQRFIATQQDATELSQFASALADQLQSSIGPGPGSHARLGFHVAGFEDFNGTRVPSFYHVHDGPSTTLQSQGITVDPTRFNANHDMPPAVLVAKLALGHGWITRNGDYQLYGHIFGLLETLFQHLRAQGIAIPHSQRLPDRAEYLVFQIRTISGLYRLSNLVPGIGGPISFLTISPDGIELEGMSHH
jgi:hypothetical protein